MKKTNTLAKPKQISSLDAFIFWITTTSLTSILLLVLNVFSSINALIIGTFFFLAIILLLKISIHSNLKKTDPILLMVLLIALFFRSKPYLYIMGKQDEGIYVNMSSYYENHGSTFIKDKIRTPLKIKEKKIYDSYNQESIKIKPEVPEKRGEGYHLLGIYIKDLSKSEYVFQFYPLHPIWMAIFAQTFGSNNRVYSLVFFSILSIIAFYLLTFEISKKNKLSARLVAFFLAVNPLHAFFSKFPVSEIISLFFSSAGFYYLIKCYKTKNENSIFYLILSAGLFWCLFFNHIAGFMYIPLFILLLLSIFFTKEKRIQKYIMLFCLLIFSGFILSLLYGCFYSSPYFFYIYRYGLDKLLGHKVLKIKPSLLGFLLFIIIFVFKQFKKRRKKYTTLAFKFIPYTIYTIFLLALYKTYNLAFTAKYVGGNLDHGNIFNHGQESLGFSNLVVFISYLSPLGFLTFLLAIFKTKKQKDILIKYLTIFLTYFLFIRIIIEFCTPYQYYYARYLLGEIIPYSLMLIGWYLSKLLKNKKLIVSLIIILISLYSLYYTSFQLQGQEADGANQALEKIANRLDEKDLLLVNPEFKNTKIITPLCYYFDLNVVVLDIDQTKNKEILKPLFRNHNNIFYLTKNNIFDSTRLLDIILYKEGAYEVPNKIPKKFSYFSKLNLHLYKLQQVDQINLSKAVDPRALYDLRGFHERSGWTKGNGIIKNFSYNIDNNQYLVLKSNGHNPFEKDLQKLNLSIFVNDNELEFIKKDGLNYFFALDKTTKQINKIQIKSTTFVPKKMSINSDDRTLGINIESIYFE